MKLSLKKFRTSSQNSFSHIEDDGGCYRWSSVGDTVCVPDTLGFKLLGLYSDMLEIEQHEVEIVRRGRPPKYDNKAEV